MAIFYLIIFFIGLGFGSFASVIIHRLHTREKGIFWGRSKCLHCAHKLNTVDLIPLLGFLINQFRCRYCKEPIPYRYPLLEITMGIGFLATTILAGFDNLLLLAYYLLLVFIFVVLSFYDIFFQEIPDIISLSTILLTGLFGFLGHLHTPSSLLIGFVVPVFFFSTLFLVSGGRWLGGGDIRLGAIMGFVLGWPIVVVGLFWGYLLGSIYSTIGLMTKKLSRKSPIPFGPFLLSGTYIAMFWGRDMLNWYLGLL